MTKVLVAERTQRQAQGLRESLNPKSTSLILTDGSQQRTVSDELLTVLLQVVDSIARGGTIQVGTMPAELTTSAAADVLGISRGTLMKKIAAGELAARKVGTHHRLRRDDVLQFRRARLEEQRAALAELLEIESEHNLD